MWYTWFIVINKYTCLIGGCNMSNNRILTELPRIEKGLNKGKINRQTMVGMDLKLLYNNEIYNVKIINYIKKRNPYFVVEYDNKIYNVDCGHFISGQFGGIFTKSLWESDRWVCLLGVSEEDAKRYSRGSHNKIKVKCPHCGNTKEIVVYHLIKNNSINCTCRDGISYPEKFMINVLDQLNIEYIFQLTKTTLGWCENFRYDFYIPSINTIIETHGGQHYKDCSWSKVEDVQKNDSIKYELALQNRISNYIVIDCRYSDKEYIKNSVLNSRLSELFDLSEIDWVKCDKDTQKNLVKEVCEYWNNKAHWETTEDLVKYFGLSRPTIIDYLKKGTILSWCYYDGKEELKKVGRIKGEINGKRGGKKTEMYDLDGNFIMKESSAVKLKERCLKELNIDLDTRHISAVCNGKRKTHKGYIFKYID